jgi:hypothetical protein
VPKDGFACSDNSFVGIRLGFHSCSVSFDGSASHSEDARSYSLYFGGGGFFGSGGFGFGFGDGGGFGFGFGDGGCFGFSSGRGPGLSKSLSLYPVALTPVPDTPFCPVLTAVAYNVISLSVGVFITPPRPLAPTKSTTLCTLHPTPRNLAFALAILVPGGARLCGSGSNGFTVDGNCVCSKGKEGERNENLGKHFQFI